MNILSRDNGHRAGEESGDILLRQDKFEGPRDLVLEAFRARNKVVAFLMTEDRYQGRL